MYVDIFILPNIECTTSENIYTLASFHKKLLSYYGTYALNTLSAQSFQSFLEEKQNYYIVQ